MSEPTVPTTPNPQPTIVIEHPAPRSWWRRHGQKVFWFAAGAIATGLAASYLDDNEDKEEKEETEN